MLFFENETIYKDFRAAPDLMGWIVAIMGENGHALGGHTVQVSSGFYQTTKCSQFLPLVCFDISLNKYDIIRRAMNSLSKICRDFFLNIMPLRLEGREAAKGDIKYGAKTNSKLGGNLQGNITTSGAGVFNTGCNNSFFRNSSRRELRRVRRKRKDRRRQRLQRALQKEQQANEKQQQFAADKIGNGRLNSGDGDLCEGELHGVQKHGKGTMHFADGRVFTGEYSNDEMMKGKMTYQDGSTCDGSWLDGMRNGYGKFAFADGSVYEGSFIEGFYHGVGKMTSRDSTSLFEGVWRYGEIHDMGKEAPQGSIPYDDGEWSEDKPTH